MKKRISIIVSVLIIVAAAAGSIYFFWVMRLAYDHPPQFPDPFIGYFIEVGKKNHDFNKKSFEDLVKGDLDLLENRLMKIKAPTLILWGLHDKIFLISNAGIFKNKIANSKLVVLDTGHVTYVDKPEKTLKSYIKFLAELKK